MAEIARRSRRVRSVAITLAIVASAVSTVVATRASQAAEHEIPRCAAFDVADILGWWRGEDDFTAEIGLDLNGTGGFTDGVVHRAVTLDGDDYLSAALFPPVGTGITVETWVRPVYSDQAQALMTRWRYASTNDSARSYALLLVGNDLLWLTDEVTLRRPVEMRASAPQLFDGQFHHVAATWDQSAISIYVDGVNIASQPSQGGMLNDARSSPFRLGSSAGPGSPFFFSGDLDEPAVFSRGLSAAEISAIHAAGIAGKCRDWSLQQKLTAADAAPFDHFGWSADVDGTTAVVGANTDDDLGSGSGSAHVLTRTASGWVEQAKLLAADGAAFDQFGWSVAVDGDTIVVGSFNDDDAGDDSGAAYVFVRAGTTWSQQAKLTAADAGAGDQFGVAVALDGDTIVVGANTDDDAGNASGAAYVFVRAGTTWSQQAKLTAADAGTGDELGRALALSADTVVVGAYLDDDAGSWSGSAYVFVRSGTAWTQQAKLTAADASAGDQFGWSLAIDADTILVGADADSDPALSNGSAYVFVRTGTSWAQQAKLGVETGADHDQFGWSVAVHGNTAIVGAAFDDYAGPNSGSAYTFVRSGSTWKQTARLTGDPSADPATPPPPGSGVTVTRPPAEDWFGWAVAFDGATALVSAAFDSGTADEVGAVFTFTQNALPENEG